MKLPISVLTAVLIGAIGYGTFSEVKAQTLVNGNFDTDISGWTTSGPYNLWQGGAGSDTLPGYGWINDIPGPTPYLEQTVTGLTSGQSYNFSGYYKSDVLFFGSDSFKAQVDGTTYFSNPDTSFVSGWTPFSFDYTATGSSATLRLVTQVGNDSDYDVDSISVRANRVTATPEPGSVALLVCSGVSSGLFLLRKKKTKSDSKVVSTVAYPRTQISLHS